MMRCVMLFLSCASIARAAACPPGLDGLGQCVSGGLLQWCEDGAVKSLQCDAHEVCAWNEAADAFDCLALQCSGYVDGRGEQTVPPEGVCSADLRIVYWCEAGHLRSVVCADDTACGTLPANDTLDCVPPPAPDSARSGAEDTEPAPEGPRSGAEEDANPQSASDSTEEGAATSDPALGSVPPIGYHESEAEPTSRAPMPTDGCLASGRSPGRGPWTTWVWALVALGVLRLRESWRRDGRGPAPAAHAPARSSSARTP